MRSTPTHPTIAVTATAAALLLAAGLNNALAAETGKSLYEQRQGIYQGTSRGILLFGADAAKPAAPVRDPKAAAQQAAAPAAAASVPALSSSAPAALPTDRAALFSAPSLNKLAPPTGIPLNAVRHQVGAERGVALPVARPASDAKP